MRCLRCTVFVRRVGGVMDVQFDGTVRHCRGVTVCDCACVRASIIAYVVCGTVLEMWNTNINICFSFVVG